MVFDLPSCVANIEKLFQHRACVIAESAVTKALCEGLVSASRLCTYDVGPHWFLSWTTP